MNHPAKFQDDVLREIRIGLGDARTVLDPFAGIGRIHELRPKRTTFGVEIEPEWAAASPYTILGDSRRLHQIWGPIKFDACATSPAYGNRLADSYDGRDGTKRSSYRISLGRELADGNGAGMHWGNEYRDLHAEVWVQVGMVLAPSARIVLNVSDHIRAGERQPVTQWHIDVIKALGFQVLTHVHLATRRFTFGANADKRVDSESVIVFER